MKPMQWTTVDKSKWGDGPWQSEPDKEQWTDEVTGLPCLIVRGPMGALCGYVGVGPEHPWHGVNYSGCGKKNLCGKEYCSHSPESLLDVHGGITFADACRTPDPEKWHELQTRMQTDKMGAKDWAQIPDKVLEDYDAYVQHCEATGICHTTEPGDFEPAWWFGFDCAHAGDVMPKMHQYSDVLSHLHANEFDQYRDVTYVKEQCARLAHQLRSRAALSGRTRRGRVR